MSEENKDNKKETQSAGAKQPAKETPAIPQYEELKDDPILAQLKERFPDGCLEGWSFIGQRIYKISREYIVPVCKYLRDEMEFNMLADLTAVDYVDREKRFTIVYNLYSFNKNTRILLHVDIGENEEVPSVIEVWSSANWPEREVWDLFGIKFENHPDLRRILLPEDWTGHPLRKDYDITGRDQDWIARHLELRYNDDIAQSEEAND